MGDDADLDPLGLEDRALFDMQLEHGVHLARADLFRAFPADPFQLIAKALALRIDPRVSPILRVPPRKYTRGKHRGGKARPLLIGPVHDDDGVFRLDTQIVERADHLQPAQDAKYPVIFAARRLGVEVASHIDRCRIWVGAFATGEHIAHLVKAHGATRRLAPALEKRAALRILIGQGLAVVATRHARPDLGHFHERIP